MITSCYDDFRKISGRLQEEMQIFFCVMKRVLDLTIFIFLAQIKHSGLLQVSLRSKVSLWSLSSLKILRLTVGA